jgi:hypothetical protein
VYALSRIGFAGPSVGSLLKVFALSLFCIVTPLLLKRTLKRILGAESTAWYASSGALTFVVLLFVLILALVSGLINFPLVVVFEAASPLLLLYVCYRAAKAPVGRRPVISVLILAVMGVWVASVVWGSGYLTPLFVEQLIAGKGQLDTIFHTGLSNMILTYGVPSTGIDGLTRISYHFGSHYLFAQLPFLLGVGVPEVYNLVYPVVFVPLMFNTFISFAIDVREHRRLDTPLGAAFWLLMTFAFVGVFPATVRKATAVGWNENIVSESYLVAIILFFSIASVIISFWQSRSSVLTAHGAERPKAGDFVFLYGAVPVVMGVIGFVKVSQMYLLFIPLVYLSIRLRLLKNPHVVVSLLLSAIVFAFVYMMTAEREASPLMPFAFMRSYVSPLWWLFYPFVFYGLALAYFFMRTFGSGAARVGDIINGVRGRNLVDVEAVLVIALVGAVPGALIAIGGGSAAYFSGFQRWLALACILGVLDEGMLRRMWNGYGNGKPLRDWNGRSTIGVIVIFLCAASSLENVAVKVSDFVMSNLRVRNAIVQQSEPSFDAEKSVQHSLRSFNLKALSATIAWLTSRQIQTNIQGCADYQGITALLRLGELPYAEKRGSALYIPPDVRAYWGMNRQISYTSLFWSKTTPLLAPCLSGIALMGGVPSLIPYSIGDEEVAQADIGPDTKKALLSLYQTDANGTLTLMEGPDNATVAKAEEALMTPYRRFFSSYGYVAYVPPVLPKYYGMNSFLAVEADARKDGFKQLIILESANGSLQWRKMAL